MSRSTRLKKFIISTAILCLLVRLLGPVHPEPVYAQLPNNDTQSIMHYGATAFGRPSNPANPNSPPLVTIQSRDGSPIGPSGMLSMLDIEGINRLYPDSGCAISPVLYQFDNFGGRTYNIQHSASDLGHFSFNNRTSSLCVPDGWIVTLFGKDDYGGKSVPIVGPQTIADLKTGAPDGRNWHDRASSIRVEGDAASLAPPDCETTPILFQFDHYQGRRIRLQGDMRNLKAARLNDRGSSICVPSGWSINAFGRSNFRGNSITITSNVADLHSTDSRDNPLGQLWGDRISSLKVNRP